MPAFSGVSNQISQFSFLRKSKKIDFGWFKDVGTINQRSIQNATTFRVKKHFSKLKITISVVVQFLV